MSTPSISARSFRIEEEIWEPAMEKAKDLGVSLSFIIKNYLKQFGSSHENIIIFDEGNITPSDEMQKKSDELLILATQKIQKRFSSQS